MNKENKRPYKTVSFKIPDIKLDYGSYYKKLEFLGTVNSRMKFRSHTVIAATGETKSRIVYFSLYKNKDKYTIRIKNKYVDVSVIIKEFLSGFKLEPPVKLVAICPKCNTPLQLQWRDTVNAVYQYVAANNYIGIGDSIMEREYNMEAGNYDCVFCPKCNFTEKNPKKIKGIKKVRMSKKIDVENPIDVLEFKMKP